VISWDKSSVARSAADFRLSIKNDARTISAISLKKVHEVGTRERRFARTTVDDNGPDRRFVRYIVCHLRTHTYTHKEKERERDCPVL